METRRPACHRSARSLCSTNRRPLSRSTRPCATNKVRRAIDGMVNGDCRLIKDAAEHAGLDPASLSRALDKPHVAAYLRQRVLKRLGIAAARAGATKIELLDSANELVRDRSSSFVLGLADIAPATAPALNVNIEMKAGYIVDLSEPPPALRVIPHE
jgi:hypothetical protein